MTIRPATLDDAQGIAHVHIEAWRTAYRGILPAAKLDGLFVDARRDKWRTLLAKDAPSEFIFVAGKASNRYVDAELAFDIAICSHFLFLYSEQLSEDFHVESIHELCRVIRDVPVYPLLELGSAPSLHVAAVEGRLRGSGYKVQIEQVDYEFQRGGNQMMRVIR